MRKEELMKKTNKQLVNIATTNVGKIKTMSYDVAIITTLVLDKTRYNKDEKVPSLRAFAKTIGYNHSTLSNMKKALDFLEKNNLVSVIDNNSKLFDYNKINFIESHNNELSDYNFTELLTDYTKSEIENLLKVDEEVENNENSTYLVVDEVEEVTYIHMIDNNGNEYNIPTNIANKYKVQ